MVLLRLAGHKSAVFKQPLGLKRYLRQHYGKNLTGIHRSFSEISLSLLLLLFLSPGCCGIHNTPEASKKAATRSGALHKENMSILWMWWRYTRDGQCLKMCGTVKQKRHISVGSWLKKRLVFVIIFTNIC